MSAASFSVLVACISYLNLYFCVDTGLLRQYTIMKRFLILILGAMVSLASCQKAPFIEIEGAGDIQFSEYEEAASLSFSANREWKIISSESWCKVTPSSGGPSDSPITVNVNCEQNPKNELRECILTVQVDDIKKTVLVRQSGWVFAESISLSIKKIIVIDGDTAEINATISPSNASEKEIVWTSTDPDVATIDNGRIITRKMGIVHISAKAGEAKSTDCFVYVVGKEYSGLCLEAIDDGEIIIKNPLGLTIEYSKDLEEWKSASDEIIRIGATSGEVIGLRGDNLAYSKNDFLTHTSIDCTADFYIYGNLTSLFYKDTYDARSVHIFESKRCDILYLYPFALASLFKGNGHIFNHPDKPIRIYASDFAPYCFYSLFDGCVGLTKSPEIRGEEGLPALRGCFQNMFRNCSNLIDAPVLPSTELEESCYSEMFRGCEKLLKAPALPATNLGPQCYSGMFMNCISLKEAPELPASKLADYCYSYMFEQCKGIREAPALPAKELATSCYFLMFSQCSSLEKAPELPAIDLEIGCYQYMFMMCTALTTAPILPAEQLVDNCYYGMFYYCSSLSFVNMKALEIPSNTCLQTWLAGVQKEGTFVRNKNASWELTGSSGIPESWTIRYE